MKCENCGSILENPKAKFCPHCGARLTPEDTGSLCFGEPASPEEEPEPPTEPVRPAEPVRRAQPVRSAEPVRPAPPAEPEPPVRPYRQEPAQNRVPQPQRTTDVRTIVIAVLVVVIVILLATELFLMTRKPSETVPAGTPVPTAAADAAEATPAPETPAPAASAPETSSPALQMPAAAQEPEYAQDVSYPGLDVQPSLIWREGNQATFRVATKADNLNMRKGPDTGYDLVGQAPHDGLVSRVGKMDNDDGWVLILYNGTYGWVSAQYLEPLE